MLCLLVGAHLCANRPRVLNFTKCAEEQHEHHRGEPLDKTERDRTRLMAGRPPSSRPDYTFAKPEHRQVQQDSGAEPACMEPELGVQATKAG
jgi:hypothetical protein